MVAHNSKTFNDWLASFLQENNPQKAIMHFNDQTITMAELGEKVELYTRHLIRLGVKPGVGVGYTMPNRPELFYLLLSVSRLGGYAVPSFHMIPDAAKANFFKNCRVQWVITTPPQLSSLQAASIKAGAGYKIATIDADANANYSFTEAVDCGINPADYLLKETDPDLPLMMASSSGTTGSPKRVIMTQGNIGAVVKAAFDLAEPMNIHGDGYSSVIAFPLSTSGILMNIGILFTGVTLIFSQDMSPVKYLQLLTRWRADSMSAPPAYYESILGLPMLDNFDLTSIKRVFTGMDFLSPSLMQRLKAKFVNLNSAGNGYGLTETTLVFMISKALSEPELDQPLNGMKLVEDAGNIIDVRDENGRSVAVGELGELYVKGASVVNGYVDNPEETQNSFRDGWFKTGDLVRNEGPNTITLLGRKKYLIKRGGKSVSPIIIQDHLNTLRGVKNSAVVGVPHQLYGEMIWAFIVKDQEDDVQLKDIMRHCRAELPNYMIPDQVTFIEEIPKNPGVGKVNFEKLKEMASHELQLINGGDH